MKWQNANDIWPQGYVILEGTPMSNEDLANSNIPFINSPSDKMARNMVIKKMNQVYGSEGEYALVVDYDIFNVLPHTEDEYPLNCYGQAMLINYLNLNNISPDKYKHEFFSGD